MSRFVLVVVVLTGLTGVGPDMHAAETPAGNELDLTLAEAVTLALSANPALVSARLGRVLERYDFDRAGEWFQPRVSVGSLSARRSVLGPARERSWDLVAGPRVDMRLPTGGSVSLMPGWTATAGPVPGRWDERADVTVALRQPLLRGGGFDVGLAPVRLARLDEESNVLRFEAAIMDVVVAVTGAYRALIEAELGLDINRRSLQRARDTLAVNRLLVQTGRMASRDVTQTEAEIAARELGVVESGIRLDDARRDLNVLLDLDGSVRVKPAEGLEPEPVALDLERSRTLAREHGTGYRQALLAVRRSEIRLALARNGALWDLSLDASARFLGSGNDPGDAFDNLAGVGGGNYAVALSLSIPVGGDRARHLRRQRLAAELAMREAHNALATRERETDTAVRNAVRAVDSGVRRMEVARAALKLAEEKLEIERGKLTLGLSSNFQLAQYETDLLNAQVGELRARIDYMNAVTMHDRTVGTLLETWAIDVGQLPEPPGTRE